jgi:hypothetical protein
MLKTGRKSSTETEEYTMKEKIEEVVKPIIANLYSSSGEGQAYSEDVPQEDEM